MVTRKRMIFEIKGKTRWISWDSIKFFVLSFFLSLTTLLLLVRILDVDDGVRRIAYHVGHCLLGDLHKGIADMEVGLGTTFEEFDSIFISEHLTSFCLDHFLICHVRFVPDQNALDRISRMLVNRLHPVSNVQKGVLVSDVVDQEDPICTAVIGRSYRAKAFLTCRVPDLKLDPFTVQVNGLDLEVDSNRSNESRREGIVRKSEQQAGFSDTGIANHQQLDQYIVSLRHFLKRYTSD